MSARERVRFTTTNQSEGLNDRLLETQRRSDRTGTELSSDRQDFLGEGRLQRTERFMQVMRDVINEGAG